MNMTIVFLVFCRLSTDPKIHDLEWQPLRNDFYILTVESAYTHDQLRRAEAHRDPQNIWDPRKNCGSFVYAIYIVGTLTNKANISIQYYLRRHVWSSEVWLSKLGYS